MSKPMNSSTLFKTELFPRISSLGREKLGVLRPLAFFQQVIVLHFQSRLRHKISNQGQRRINKPSSLKVLTPGFRFQKRRELYSGTKHQPSPCKIPPSSPAQSPSEVHEELSPEALGAFACSNGFLFVCKETGGDEKRHPKLLIAPQNQPTSRQCPGG